MTLGSGLRVLASRWSLSHGAAIAVGLILGARIMNRSLEGASTMGGTFERQPFEHAVWFAYTWGSTADASELLGEYAGRLRSDPKWEPFAGSSQLALTEFQRAIVERRSRAEIAELCRTTPKCKPDTFDVLISKLSARRKITEPQ